MTAYRVGDRVFMGSAAGHEGMTGTVIAVDNKGHLEGFGTPYWIWIKVDHDPCKYPDSKGSHSWGTDCPGLRIIADGCRWKNLLDSEE